MATLTFESTAWSDVVGYHGYDVHLVRQAGAVTSTGPLLPLLRLVFTEDTEATDPEDADHKLPKSGFTVVFTAVVPRPANGYPSQFDFDLNPNDGTVTAIPVSPTKVVRNFIVLATVTETATSKQNVARIRVHLHPGISAVHLQPKGMHLRQGTTAHFSVFAEFTDLTAGDVSYHDGIQYSLVDGPLTVQASGFFLPTASSGTGHIRAQLPANLGGIATAPSGSSQDGEVNLLPAWDALPIPVGAPAGFNPYLAERIEPGPGTLQRNEPDVKNVIFLPEGFTSGQRQLFEALADGLVKNELGTSSLYRPFDLLKERINYYRLWIEPSGDEGITELNDLAPLAGTLGHGTLVPTPEPPPATGIEDLVHLIYQVGLPTPTDPIAGDVTSQITAWNAIYGAGFVTFSTAPNVVPAVIFAQWKNLQNYGVVTENDTLFGLAMGERPQVDHGSESEYIGFHHFRFRRAEIDVLLAKIEARDEHLNTAVNIGAELWAADTAKNASLVCFLCLGGRSIGTHWPDPVNDKTQVAMTMTDVDEPAVGISTIGTNLYAEVADVPTLRKRQKRIKVPKSQVATLAHEIAHDMNCGEEYTFQPKFIPASQKTPIDDEWNLQVADELDSTAVGVRILDERIRWRWPRVLKAGFMEGRLEQDGADWKVQMRVAYGEAFKEGDKVRYRDNRLLVKSPLGPGLPDIMRFQPPDHLLQVKPKVQGDGLDLLRLRALTVPGLPAFQNLSQPGFILYQPMLDGNDDVLIVHKAVLAHMRTDGPLSRTAATCGVNAGSDDAPQTPTHLPPELQPRRLAKPIKNKKRLLGLYDGGENFRCGIYHAAGECMMRRYALIIRPQGKRKRGTFKGLKKVRVKVTRFCHVCRYVMVDKLDPRQHGRLNGSLEYPQPKATP